MKPYQQIKTAQELQVFIEAGGKVGVTQNGEFYVFDNGAKKITNEEAAELLGYDEAFMQTIVDSRGNCELPSEEENPVLEEKADEINIDHKEEIAAEEVVPPVEEKQVDQVDKVEDPKPKINEDENPLPCGECGQLPCVCEEEKAALAMAVELKFSSEDLEQLEKYFKSFDMKFEMVMEKILKLEKANEGLVEANKELSRLILK